MFELVFAGALALLIWALMAKHPFIKALARFFTGLLTLASAGAAIFLFKVGQQAHWTSDGPGMLLVMVGIFFCGILAIVFGGLFFSSLNQSS
ncbi:MAG: hypothetical protein K2Q17_01455 [Nitrospiraceae bacterium]|jgi:hypothetical protein|uniref:hypothetical protein n=1 Tax=Nitrospira cf. moscoviensis SBR1015 TaxID=96242 RepID=UPI000A0BBA6D|nr:hypothetical protein [Nitrospira cf. moscoviensis SBR1015]MBY0246303.1 hypothetical protein [Nitrospiraceae bacterium]OQW38171.1 MAG: hypothetical protein A4E20_00350 [Nitrospira sp. SG-bin2]